ncbi:MAG TPA: glycoside hydrolase family 44 protein [Polyangiaceae bacterium]|nr:glycoside hydrolase family 44 protein [Polyangiaceae bacterium]
MVFQPARRTSRPRFTALVPVLFGSLCLVPACLRPPPLGAEPGQKAAAKGATAGGEPGAIVAAGYYEPTWGDSSGRDGKGGVKLSLSTEKKLPLVTSDFDKAKRGDKVTGQKPDWLLFHGPGELSLAIDFVWVTKSDEKYFGNAWAGGGLAFNGSWSPIDGTGARYLVLWAKANVAGVKLAVNLHSASKTKGKEDTGPIELSEFVPGGQLDGTWRRIVIPLGAFPDVAHVDLKGLQQVAFNVRGGYPENKNVAVYFDNVYLTNIDMVTPVSNLGYVARPDGVRLVWEKDAAEKVEQFAISVNQKPVLKADGKGRSVLIPTSALGSPRPTVVGIACVGANEVSDEQTVSVELPTRPALAATVKLGAPAHEISPFIFGINWGSASSIKDIGATVRRWGGNRTTKYNWKNDVDNAGVDWFFLNDYSKPPQTPEEKKKYHQFIKETLAGGAQVNFGIPIVPFIAKPHPDEKERYCSYPVKLYPEQEKTDGQGCGNGKKPNGDIIWDNDPSLSMVKNSPELQREFVETAVKHFGAASKGGVQFYSLDNEPGLWMHTHRDIMPQGVTAEQLADWNIQYATVIKTADPSAQVIGFGAWGVLELAGSNQDYLPPGPAGYKRQKEDVKEPDKFRERKKHGGDSQLVYLLKRFKQAEAQAGKRLVDTVDIHWYPELYGKDAKGEKRRVLDDIPYDKAFARLQWESIREWYDPSFQPTAELESWTAGSNREMLWQPYHPIIPALRKIVDTYYPGTKLAINEYDSGSPEHYHGALIRAAVLGIFMQENLYMAQNWHQTESNKFTYWAQKLYGNYDGKGSRVGGKFVPSQSSQPDLLTFAATSGARFRIVLVNKNPEERIEATVALPSPASRYRTYTLSETLGLRLLEDQGETRGDRIAVVVPPYAAVLIATE